MSGKEFDWGGRLRKAVSEEDSKFPQEWLETIPKSAKGRRELDCDTDGVEQAWKVRTSDPVV